MGCLKAFPNPGRRWWWWEQKMQRLLLRADLPSTEDSRRSSGTELGGKNFQVPLTPQMLHPTVKPSTPGHLCSDSHLLPAQKNWISHNPSILQTLPSSRVSYYRAVHRSPRFAPLPWEDLFALIPAGLYQVVSTALPGSSPASCLVLGSSRMGEHVGR